MIENLNYAFLGLLLVASLALWTKLGIKFGKGVPPLENRLRDPCPLGFLDLLIVFGMGWILAPTATVVILGFSDIVAFDKDASVEDRAVVSFTIGTCQLLAVLICMAGFWRRYSRASAFGWQKGYWKTDIKTGVIAFVLIFPPVILLQFLISKLIPYSHDTIAMLKESQSFFQVAASWFTAVLIAPIWEEFFFRVVLQGWLQRLGNMEPEDFSHLIMGGCFSNKSPVLGADDRSKESRATGGKVLFDSSLRWIPTFISAFLFAAMHNGQGGAHVSLFFFAVGLGYLYRQTGSLIPCVIVHFLLNLQTMFWITLGNFYSGS